MQRRTQFRLNKVLDRIHILEGRQLVLLNIDEVIAIIRQSDEPKPALMTRFKLSERQAEDILEIRLRQLARLEAIKIEQELKELREERSKLEDILGSATSLRKVLVKEIEADAKQFGDARRTLIQEDKRAVIEVKIIDEPVTVVVSEKGWVRVRQGHGHEPLGHHGHEHHHSGGGNSDPRADPRDHPHGHIECQGAVGHYPCGDVSVEPVDSSGAHDHMTGADEHRY